jgi:hypothetical protein
MASAQDSLSHKQLQGLFPGSFTVIVKGFEIKITAGADGTLLAAGKGFKDSGHWSLKNGQLCIAMDTWTQGRATCSGVIADNGWYVGPGVKFRKS